MDSLKRYLLIAAGLLVCSLALSSTTVVQAVVEKTASVFVTNDSAHAVPVAVTNLPAVQGVSGSVAVSNFPATQQVTGTVTTVGRAPSEFVTLVHVALDDGFRRQFSNGAFDSSDFVIPAGKVLVITDINLTFRRGLAEAGTTAEYFLRSSDGTAGTFTRARLQTTLNGESRGGTAQHYQTGIVFASTSALIDNIDSVTSFDVAELRGYLADDN
jgi:hypothetical protein